MYLDPPFDKFCINENMNHFHVLPKIDVLFIIAASIGVIIS